VRPFLGPRRGKTKEPIKKGGIFERKKGLTFIPLKGGSALMAHWKIEQII